MNNQKIQIPTYKIIWISYFILFITVINLTGCASVSGNVVPTSGPKMEHVYDSMQSDENIDKSDAPLGTSSPKTFNEIRTEINKQVPKPSEYHFKKYQPTRIKDFKKIPNPELPLYVYPHFAGQDQVPVPGYFTGFSACEKDFWTLKI